MRWEVRGERYEVGGVRWEGDDNAGGMSSRVQCSEAK